jgi:sporulation protein YlmC with PRC-barrel domain
MIRSLYVLMLALCVAAQAATSVAQETPRDTRTSSTEAGKLDEKTPGATIRASQFIGMDIYNEQGDSVGEINDLVLDVKHGHIRYAAVTYGGFLGVGDKMFAVPWEAFRFRQDPDDADERYLVLNVTQQQLEGAEGFDQDHWPNFADPKFTAELDKRYGVERRTGRRGVEVDVKDNGVDVDVNPNRDR